MERRCRGHDDGQRHQIGETHAKERVELDALQRARPLLGGGQQVRAEGEEADVLGLFGGLPEEEIGADGGAQHRHDGGEVILVEDEAGQHQIHRQPAPVHVHHHHGGEIGEERQRQPFQHLHIAGVIHEDLQPDAEGAEAQHQQPAGRGDKERGGVRHGAEIRPQIDHIGHQQQADHGAHERGRVVAAQHPRQPQAGHPADSRADHLGGGHEGPGKQHDPGQPIAELGARLRIGGDAAGVVIGGAGDEARPQHIQPARPAPARDGVRAFGIVGRLWMGHGRRLPLRRGK